MDDGTVAELREKTAVVRLLQEIAAAANESSSSGNILKFAIDRLCEFAGWPVGHVYLPAPNSPSEFVSSGIWHLSDPVRFSRLVNETQESSIFCEAGLADGGGAAGKSSWSESFSACQGPERPRIAAACGLKGCFSFPVTAGNRIAAILEFCSETVVDIDQAFLEITSFVALQLSHVIQRQQAEAELRASELRFRSVVQTATDAIVLADEESRIILWNRGAEQIFGYAEVEILGFPLELLIPERYRDAHRMGIRNYRLNGKSRIIGRTIALEGLRKDGRDFPMELSLASWRTTEGTFFAGIFRDLTERRRSEELRAAREAAEDASDAKGAFVARISRDLRTPLTAIIGFANLLLKNRQGNLLDQDVDFLQRILRNAKDQLRLINGILDLSRIEGGKMEIELADVALESVVRDVVQQVEGHRSGNQVELVLDIPMRLAPIHTDAGKLKQIVLNLVANALEFTTHGSVTIRVHTMPYDRIPSRIDVIDTGIGIPADRITDIFEPFSQVPTRFSRSAAGTGFGLSISRSLAQLLGHAIQVESRPGHGSTFSLILDADYRRMPLSA